MILYFRLPYFMSQMVRYFVHALGTSTKFQPEIITIDVIAGIVYFCEIVLERSRNVREKKPGHSAG